MWIADDLFLQEGTFWHIIPIPCSNILPESVIIMRDQPQGHTTFLEEIMHSRRIASRPIRACGAAGYSCSSLFNASIATDIDPCHYISTSRPCSAGIPTSLQYHTAIWLWISRKHAWNLHDKTLLYPHLLHLRCINPATVEQAFYDPVGLHFA